MIAEKDPEKEQMKKEGRGKRINQQNSVLHQEVTMSRSHPCHAHIACRCSRLILGSTVISGLTTNPVLIEVVAPFPHSIVPTVGIHLGRREVFFCRRETIIS